MRYTEHAQQRMEQRGISEKDVEMCKRNGEWFRRRGVGTYIVHHCGISVMINPYSRQNVVQTAWKGEVGPSYTKRRVSRHKRDTKYQDAKHWTRDQFRNSFIQ